MLSLVSADLDCFDRPSPERSPALEPEPTASAWVFLPESRDLPLNEKVPVALLLWSGGALPACSLEDYWDPARLAGLDLVQAVTVEFTDQAL